MLKSSKIIIGRVEKISFPELGVNKTHAKIDSGADLSAVWATAIREKDGLLKFKLFGKKHPQYTGREIVFKRSDYLLTKITNSFGQSELRYVVKLQVKIGGKLVRGTFSLSDRGKKTYPILIGRKLLNKKFLVDVSKGSPLTKLEQAEKKKIQKEINEFNKWEKRS